MSGEKKRVAKRDNAFGTRRAVAYALAMAMTLELVPAQGIRAVLPAPVADAVIAASGKEALAEEGVEEGVEQEVEQEDPSPGTPQPPTEEPTEEPGTDATPQQDIITVTKDGEEATTLDKDFTLNDDGTATINVPSDMTFTHSITVTKGTLKLEGEGTYTGTISASGEGHLIVNGGDLRAATLVIDTDGVVINGGKLPSLQAGQHAIPNTPFQVVVYGGELGNPEKQNNTSSITINQRRVTAAFTPANDTLTHNDLVSGVAHRTVTTTVTDEIKGTALVLNQDYVVSYINTKDGSLSETVTAAGTYLIKITGVQGSDYEGLELTTTAKYYLTGVPVGNWIKTIEVSDLIYNGIAQIPDFKLLDTNNQSLLTRLSGQYPSEHNPYTLEEGTDFRLNLENNITAADKTLGAAPSLQVEFIDGSRVSGKTDKKPFTIGAYPLDNKDAEGHVLDPKRVEIQPIGAQVRSDSITPEVTVKFTDGNNETRDLTPYKEEFEDDEDDTTNNDGAEYQVIYGKVPHDDTKGTVTISSVDTVAGKNFTGSDTVEFEIKEPVVALGDSEASSPDKLFLTVTDALQAAAGIQNGTTAEKTVYLLQNIEEESVTVPTGAEAILNLNGHKLTGVINNYGTLEVIGVIEGSKLQAPQGEGGNSVNVINNDGAFILTSGTIEGNVAGAGTVRVSGGTIDGSVDGKDKVVSSSDDPTDNTDPQETITPSITVTGGTITGNVNSTSCGSVVLTSETLEEEPNQTITGGTIKGSVTIADEKTLNMSAGIIEGTLTNSGNATISGGEVKANVVNNGAMLISGGTVANGTQEQPRSVTNSQGAVLTVGTNETNDGPAPQATVGSIISEGRVTLASGANITGDVTSKEGALTVDAGTIGGKVDAQGVLTVRGGTFNGAVTYSGEDPVSTIEGGTFTKAFTNNGIMGILAGGAFGEVVTNTGTIKAISNAVASDAQSNDEPAPLTFAKLFINQGTITEGIAGTPTFSEGFTNGDSSNTKASVGPITGGTFIEAFTNMPSATIGNVTGGNFTGGFTNKGTMGEVSSGVTVGGEFVNDETGRVGNVTGGTFTGTLTNKGVIASITGGTFTALENNATEDKGITNGISGNASFSGEVTNNGAAELKVLGGVFVSEPTTSEGKGIINYDASSDANPVRILNNPSAASWANKTDNSLYKLPDGMDFVSVEETNTTGDPSSYYALRESLSAYIVTATGTFNGEAQEPSEYIFTAKANKEFTKKGVPASGSDATYDFILDQDFTVSNYIPAPNGQLANGKPMGGGTYTATVTGVGTSEKLAGGASATTELTYTLEKLDLSDSKVSVSLNPNGAPYSGEDQSSTLHPIVTIAGVEEGDQDGVPKNWYVLGDFVKSIEVDPLKNVGDYPVKVQATENNPNFKGERSAGNYTITRVPVTAEAHFTSVDTNLEVPVFMWTGKEVCPPVTVDTLTTADNKCYSAANQDFSQVALDQYLAYKNNNEWPEGTTGDYYVSYENNTNVSSNAYAKAIVKSTDFSNYRIVEDLHSDPLVEGKTLSFSIEQPDAMLIVDGDDPVSYATLNDAILAANAIEGDKLVTIKLANNARTKQSREINAGNGLQSNTQPSTTSLTAITRPVKLDLQGNTLKLNTPITFAVSTEGSSESSIVDTSTNKSGHIVVLTNDAIVAESDLSIDASIVVQDTNPNPGYKGFVDVQGGTTTVNTDLIITGDKAYAIKLRGGNLVVNEEVKSCDASAIVVDAQSDVTISGTGSVSGSPEGIKVNNCGGKLTISDGTITGDSNGIKFNGAGKLTITGGTIVGNSGHGVDCDAQVTELRVSGGTIESEGEDAYAINVAGNLIPPSMTGEGAETVIASGSAITGGIFKSSANTPSSINMNPATKIVAGGYFSHIVPLTQVAEGYLPKYEPESAGDNLGLYTVSKGTAVAELQAADSPKLGRQYASLQEALDDAPCGSTVKLLSNATGSKCAETLDGKVRDQDLLVVWDQENADDDPITLDLNGYTISTYSMFVMGNLKIDDTSVVQQGKIDLVKDNDNTGRQINVMGKEASAGRKTTGKLTLKGGSIVNGEHGAGNQYGIYVLYGGELNVEGGSIKTNGPCISGNNLTETTKITITGGTLESKEGPAIYQPGQGELNISGGEIRGGVAIRLGEISITGGEISAATPTSQEEGFFTEPAAAVNSNSPVTFKDAVYVLGGTYSTHVPNSNNDVKLTISENAHITSDNPGGSAVAVYNYDKVDGARVNTNITGGTFVGGDSDVAESGRSAYQTITASDLNLTPASQTTTTTTITGGSFSTAISENTEGSDLVLFTPGQAFVKSESESYSLAESLSAYNVYVDEGSEIAKKVYTGESNPLNENELADIKLYPKTCFDADNIVVNTDRSQVLGSQYYCVSSESYGCADIQDNNAQLSEDGLPLNAGLYTVKLVGNQVVDSDTGTTITYAGNAVATFEIKPFDITVSEESSDSPIASTIEGVTFDPDAVADGKGVYPADSLTSHMTFKDKPLTKDIDYVLAAAPYGGTANKVTSKLMEGEVQPSVNVIGKGNFTGTRALAYGIAPYDLTGDSVTLTSGYTYTYKGANVEPGVKVSVGNTPVVLSSGTDYDVTYNDNEAPGTGTVTVTGKGNYTGRPSKSFTINSLNLATDISEYSVELAEGADPIKTTLVLRGDYAEAAVDAGNFSYTGTAHTPEIRVKVGERTFTSSSDTPFDGCFNLRYFHNNTNVGNASVALAGVPEKGFTGELVISFPIDTLALTPAEELEAPGDAQLTFENAQLTYNGEVQKPEATLTAFVGDNSIKLTSEDYDVSYHQGSADGEVVEPTDAGTYYAVATPKGNYTLANADEPLAAEFTIEPVEITDAYIQNIAAVTYTGELAAPLVEVTINNKNLERSVDGTTGDYKVEIENNPSNMNAGTGELTVTGINNYSGSVAKTFTIAPAPIKLSNVGTVADQPYTGMEIKPIPAVTVQLGNKEESVTLQPDTDFVLSWDQNTMVGNGKVVLTTKENSNYYVSNDDGSAAEKLEKSFAILEKNIATEGEKDPEIRIGGGDGMVVTRKADGSAETAYTTTFSGQPQQPRIVVDLGEGKACYDSADTSTGFAEHFESTLSNNTNAGDAQLTLKAKNGQGLSGEVTTTFKILPLTLTKKTALTNVGDTTIALTENWAAADKLIYNGSPIKPKVDVTALLTSDGEGTLLTEGTDYTVSYEKAATLLAAADTNSGTAATDYEPVDAGNYNAIITFKGNYAGETITLPFTIAPLDISKEDSGVTVASIANQTYSGTAIQPQVTVKRGNTTLTENDYALVYTNNVNAGTATVTITGKGNYTGTKTVNFTIDPLNIANATNVTVDPIANQTFTGSEITPTPVVKHGDTQLTNEDYAVTYGNNINVGTSIGTVTITGKVNYTGSKTVNFTISPLDIADKAITYSAIAAQSYTGQQVQPAVTLTKGGKQLTSPADYTVEYGANVNAGTSAGSVVVKGAGNYTGTKTIAFDISPKSITSDNVKVSNTVYTGSVAKPSVEVTVGTVKLAEDTDFTVEVTNTTANINVGSSTATATVSGKGNYNGAVTSSFSITAADIQNATIAPIENQQYDGKPATPELSVSFNNNPLTPGTDYTVAYSNNKDYGTATKPAVAKATITGKGNFTGTKETIFFIITADTTALKAAIAAAQAIDPALYTAQSVNTLSAFIKTAENYVASPLSTQAVIDTMTETLTGFVKPVNKPGDGKHLVKAVNVISVTADESTSYYESDQITAAISAINEAETAAVAVSVLDNFNSTATLPALEDESANLNLNKAVTLDLGGKTIGTTGLTVGEGIDLTITGGSLNGGITVLASNASSANYNSLNINEGVIVGGGVKLAPATAATAGYGASALSINGTVTGGVKVDAAITNGLEGYKDTNTSTIAVGPAANITNSAGIGLDLAGAAIATIANGAQITGSTNGVAVSGGKLLMNGGRVAGTSGSGIDVHQATQPVSLTVNDGTVSGATAVGVGVINDADKVQLAITGGTFIGTGTGANALLIADANKAKGFVNGGWFSSKLADQSVAKGLAATDALSGANVPTGAPYTVGTALASAILSANTFDYDNTAKEPGVLIAVDSKGSVVSADSYTLSYDSNVAAGVGTATSGPRVILTAKAPYAGTLAVPFTIAPAKVDKPSAITGLTANGTLQTGVNYDGSASSPYILLQGGNVSATDAGNYSATFHITNNNYVWADGSTADVTVSWRLATNKDVLKALIDRANATLTLDKDSVMEIASSANVDTVPLDKHYVTTAQKSAIQSAISTAQGVYNNPDVSAEDVTKAASDLDTALKAYETARDSQIGVGTSLEQLAALVKEAELDRDSVAVSTDGSDVAPSKTWASASDVAKLDAAIAPAKLAGSTTTPAQLIKLATDLTKAKADFDAAKRNGTMPIDTLRTDAVAAEAAIKSTPVSKDGITGKLNGEDVAIAPTASYLPQDKESVATELQNAVTAALAAANNPNVTKTEFDAARSALDTARADFDAAIVANKRGLESAIAKATQQANDYTVSGNGSDLSKGTPYVTPSQLAALTSALTTAHAVMDNDKATGDDVASATTALTTASSQLEAAYNSQKGTLEPEKAQYASENVTEQVMDIEETNGTDPAKTSPKGKVLDPATKEALDKALNDAQTALQNAAAMELGTGEGQFSQEAIDSAVAAAQKAYDDALAAYEAALASAQPGEALTTLAFIGHSADLGWSIGEDGQYQWTHNGGVAGTTGLCKPLEAVGFYIDENCGLKGDIQVATHLADEGWQQGFKSASASSFNNLPANSDGNGESGLAGTTGQARSIEAIKLKLTGEIAEYYDVYYRVHVRDIGWLAWTGTGSDIEEAKRNEIDGSVEGGRAGSEGYGPAHTVEAIQIQFVLKGTNMPARELNGVVPVVDYPFIVK